MTDKDEVARRGQTVETLYRIHWRIASTGATGHSTGTFSSEIAEIWIKSLNADKANKALGMTHWLEPAAADEPNGVERGPVVK